MLTGYELVTSGKLLSSGATCEWIQTKEDCEKAAILLSMPDTSAIVVSNGHPVDSNPRPPGCFYHSAANGLYFNINSQSPTDCTLSINCICSTETGSFETFLPQLGESDLKI